MMRQLGLALLLASWPLASAADQVRLTVERLEATFTVAGQTFTIARNQDQANVLTGEFARTSRACPPFCIQPATAAPGVATLGELEVIAFLETSVSAGTGLLLDARMPEFFGRSTIPAAVNVPFATLEPGNPYLRDLMLALGAVDVGGTLDFSAALDLVLFCGGPWDEQSARAVRNLIAAGYPAAKLSWYRGGMQDWAVLGLTTIVPGDAG